MRRHRADAYAAVALAFDAAQFANSTQAHEPCGRREAEVHHRDERLSTREALRAVVLQFATRGVQRFRCHVFHYEGRTRCGSNTSATQSAIASIAVENWSPLQCS